MYPNAAQYSRPRVQSIESQQPHQTQTRPGLYKSSPKSPSGRNSNDATLNGMVAGQFQSIHPPQSYTAYPLQRTSSNPSQTPLRHGSIDATQNAEHMLRRKTPNGTLSAGYDGTPVEWATKPHAMKHILLPVKNNEAALQNPQFANSYGHMPTSHNAAPNQSIGNFVPSGHIQQGQQRGRMINGIGFGMDSQSDWIFSPHQPAAGYDSVLNQNQFPQGQSFYYPDQSPVPHVLQPSHQIPLGPTVSHEGGPYGPYWPDGAYIPYRPAALQDPRFNSHQPSLPWTPEHSLYSTLQWPQPSGAQPPSNAMMINLSVNTDISTTHRLDTHDSIPNENLAFARPTTYDFHAPPGSLPRAQIGAQQDQIQRPVTAIRLPTEGFAHSTTFQPDTVPTSNNAALHSMASSQTLTPGNTANSSNEQFKERVLSWAHGVYVNLLASIQQAKKHSQQTRQNHSSHSSRPGIYPRPPRQPGWSASHSDTDTFRAKRKSSTPSEPARAYSDQNVTGTSFRERQGSSGMERSNLNQSTSIQNHAAAQSRQRTQSLDVMAQGGSNIHEPLRTLRRTSGAIASTSHAIQQQEFRVKSDAKAALDMLSKVCEDVQWRWIDGMLLGGCLAYGLSDYSKALQWYSKILELDRNHVEAISNLAATLLSLNRRKEAEQYWLQAVKLRPSFFEAVEHLIGLLCGDHRGKEAVGIIEFVESSLKISNTESAFRSREYVSEDESERSRSSSAISESEEIMTFDFQAEEHSSDLQKPWDQFPSALEGFGSSGYNIPSSENGRILALVHAKGNMMYALADNAGAAKAFEDAILIGTGRSSQGISGLIQKILSVVSSNLLKSNETRGSVTQDPILLSPDRALQTAKLLFPNQGSLPGLRNVSNEMARKAAVSTTSNSLLSLAKIFQDGMSSSNGGAGPRPASGVRDILALYYLSLSLQPSPSTANNVGIVLASVQHAVIPKSSVTPSNNQLPEIPGVAHGSGIGLALQYYNYGLNLDTKHAHLYTNLGSLLKDIGHLTAAIKMYEQAVQCDEKFDIALANLANAVKDQGRISDAIGYYKRAVAASPDFAEAVCGLANALNSVCKWRGRGGVQFLGDGRDRWHVDDKDMLVDSKATGTSLGWMKRVVEIVDKQLTEGQSWGKGMLTEGLIRGFVRYLERLEEDTPGFNVRKANFERILRTWSTQPHQGARIVRMVERIIRRLSWLWYQDLYVHKHTNRKRDFTRPQLPSALSVPSAPTVLPFHTFTCPLSPRQIRSISQRNGLRISCTTLRAPWLPETVYRPPPPPKPVLNVGYVSSDFNNHPLAHLMQSVFGFHDPSRVKAFCYATTASDNSVHRKQIEKEAPVFHDASTWSADRLVNRIVSDGIHILINLNGYTRGARNEVFAARPAPIQMSFMGFAGTLGAEWCDYILADNTAIPPDTLRPFRRNVTLEDLQADGTTSTAESDWIYSENIIFARDTFFCCDHRQSAPDAKEKRLSWDEEQRKRWRMRKELFPTLSDSSIIFGNFNQLYKIEPTTFRTWLRILAGVPNAILWLLRFPELGESNLKRTAELWAGQEVASRILFTDVAPKHQHISRAAVCDLFLDTPECNAHTTAADVLWSGTPLLTLPRYPYKMCSRMAASILKGALPKTVAGQVAARELIASSDDEYERLAIKLGRGLAYAPPKQQQQQQPSSNSLESSDDDFVQGRGRLLEIRRLLFEGRWTSALFDTKRWVRDLEEAYEMAWQAWVAGEGGDIWLPKKS